MTITSSQTYAAAFAALSAIAEKLKSAGTATSIDTLAEDVRGARQAYASCKDRLDAIRAEIEAELAAVRAQDAAGHP